MNKNNRGKILSVEIKREVERGSTFTLMCDLSYIASISFANVNLTYTRKNYATVEINPYAINAYFQSNLTIYWKINILLDSERSRNCDF